MKIIVKSFSHSDQVASILNILDDELVQNVGNYILRLVLIVVHNIGCSKASSLVFFLLDQIGFHAFISCLSLCSRSSLFYASFSAFHPYYFSYNIPLWLWMHLMPLVVMCFSIMIDMISCIAEITHV